MKTAAPIDLNLLPLNLPPGTLLRHLPDGGAIGQFLNAELGSVFQPVIASDDGECVAYEAFVRTHGAGELSLSPWSLFSLVADDAALIALDRLCRTVHVLNFQRTASGGGLLFLNIHGRLLAAVGEDHGRVFRSVLDCLAVHPAQVVLETPASANSERTLLAFALANYRLNGFRVAASTTDLSDLEALVRVVRPDYVKIDARHLLQPEQMLLAIRIATDRGIRPVFTRVASAEQLEFLLSRVGVLIQGWAVGPPRKRNTADLSVLAACGNGAA